MSLRAALNRFLDRMAGVKPISEATEPRNGKSRSEEIPESHWSSDPETRAIVDKLRENRRQHEEMLRSYGPSPSDDSIYPVSVVGEQHHAAAVAKCRVGQGASICLELDNPYDDRALVVKSAGDETIGYISRDSWLHRALIDEEKPCTVAIKSVRRNQSGGRKDIVLDVQLTGEPVRVVKYCS